MTGFNEQSKQNLFCWVHKVHIFDKKKLHPRLLHLTKIVLPFFADELFSARLRHFTGIYVLFFLTSVR